MRFGGKKQANTVPLGTIPRRRLSEEHGAAAVGALNANDQRQETKENYRRNRNLTERAGSRSVNATTARESSRQAAHSLRQRRKRIALSLTLILVFAIVTWMALLQSALVVHVSFYGQLGSLDQKEEVEYSQAIGKYYASQPLQRLRVLTSLEEMTRYLQANGHNDIQKIAAIEQTGLGTVQVTIKLREPIASWAIGQKISYVDSTGTIFNQNFYTKPPISIVDKTSTQEDADESIIASSRLLRFIGLVTGQLGESGVLIKQVVLPQNTTREVDIVTSKNITVKMTIDRSAGEQSEDATRALAYFAKHHIKPKYVDVRVSRQAYYK